MPLRAAHRPHRPAACARFFALASIALAVWTATAVSAAHAQTTTLPPGVGVYVDNAVAGIGNASYASAPGVTIYSSGGLSVSSPGAGASYALTSNPTMPLGLTTATLSSIGSNTPGGGHATGTASATADLSGGVVRGITGSAADIPYQGVGPVSARVLTTSLIRDGVTFATGAAGADVTITAHLDGSFALSDPYYGSVGNSLVFSFGGSFSYYFGGNTNANSAYGYEGAVLGDFTRYAFTHETPTGFDFTGTLHVTNGEHVGMAMGLYLDCSYAACDFGNTARVGLSVPAGVTWTSDSGVFLSAAATDPGTIAAVPEPRTWALMAGGLMALVGTARRRTGRSNPQR